MQCSYDQRGNSVPTILLMMQKRLYSGGGLQVCDFYTLASIVVDCYINLIVDIHFTCLA